MYYVRRLRRVEGLMLTALLLIGAAVVASYYLLRPAVGAEVVVKTKPVVAVRYIDTLGLWAAVNKVRTEAKLPNLLLSQQLNQAAAATCHDMATKNYWGQTDSKGVPVWHFLTEAGVAYKASAENLTEGYSTTARITQAWLASDTYKTNLLNAAYTQTGFASCVYPNFQGKGPKIAVVQFLVGQ